MTEKRDDQYFEKMIENAQNLYFDSASALSGWFDASQKEIRDGHSSTAAISTDLLKNLTSMILQTKPIPTLDTFMGADQNLMSFSKASLEFSAAATELQALVISKFIEASENYVLEDTEENQSKEKTISDWLSSANSEVLEFQQSKAYLNAQKKYVTSLTKFQKRIAHC